MARVGLLPHSKGYIYIIHVLIIIITKRLWQANTDLVSLLFDISFNITISTYIIKSINFYPFCEIPGFFRSWTEFFRLLGWCAAWGGLKSTFRGHLSVAPLKVKMSWPYWPLGLGPIGSPETSVSNHLTPRNDPEDWKIQFYPHCLHNGSIRVSVDSTNVFFSFLVNIMFLYCFYVFSYPFFFRRLL